MIETIVYIFSKIDFIQICSIITPIVAVFVAIITYLSQKKHNENSVIPILDIVFGDYVNDIYVKVVNNGVGPATIKCVSCFSKEGEEDNLVGLVKIHNNIRRNGEMTEIELVTYNGFVNDIEGKTIPPNGSITFLRLETENAGNMAELRNCLKDIEINVNYTDIYSKKRWNSRRPLSFFGRTLKSDIVHDDQQP